MTTITINRATVEQALEALETLVPTKGPSIYNSARDALRAALAQQADLGEPMAHRVVAGALFDFMGWLTSRRERLVLSSIDDAAPAVDAIKDFAEMRGLSLDDAKVQDWNAALAQQAEAVEPVAWMFELGRNFDLYGYGGWEKRITEYRPNTPEGSVRNVTPLYTTPPQRKPLTDEDIERIFMTYQSPRQAARAVERAHGITDPQVADRLARHGIPMPGDPK